MKLQLFIAAIFFFGVDVYEVESWVRTWPGELCIGSVLVAVCRIGGASMETLAGAFIS